MNKTVNRINITDPIWQFDANARPINGEQYQWLRLNRWTFGLTGNQSIYVYQYCQSPEQSKLLASMPNDGEGRQFGYSEACGVWN